MESFKTHITTFLRVLLILAISAVIVFAELSDFTIDDYGIVLLHLVYLFIFIPIIIIWSIIIYKQIKNKKLDGSIIKYIIYANLLVFALSIGILFISEAHDVIVDYFFYIVSDWWGDQLPRWEAIYEYEQTAYKLILVVFIMSIGYFYYKKNLEVVTSLFKCLYLTLFLFVSLLICGSYIFNHRDYVDESDSYSGKPTIEKEK